MKHIQEYKMIKRYCDICNKQIAQNSDTCRLTAVDSVSIIYHSDDVCMDCIEKINNYIATLRPIHKKEYNNER